MKNYTPWVDAVIRGTPWAGRSILITGGTGYLGQALARHLLEHTGAERICIYSRGEFAQAQMRQAIPDPDGRLRWFIGDVRDTQRLWRACQEVNLVIHAAALKRVEVGEYNPGEMVRTNIDGAINLIEAATMAGVERVVGVSSDKACAPLNCYGATKLTMEKLLLAANNGRGKKGPIIAVVRYGNVAGSTGSVIPTWRKMIAEGAKTVPVTHPHCTRYFMRRQEAVDLIMWTAERMWGGELVVPELPAYRLETLAQALEVEMDIRGLGEGEKVDESMIALLESPGFRHVPPYLVRGGLATRIPKPNIAGIKTHMLSVEELRELLKEVE